MANSSRQDLFVYTLKNGLKVVVSPIKGLRSVNFTLKGLVGSNYEKENEIGVSHILEHYILDDIKKSQKMSGEKFRFIGITSRDTVSYIVKTLKENYKEALTCLSQCFSPPNLSQEHLRICKSIIEDEINENLSLPETKINRLAYRIIFPGTRFEHLNSGDINNINNAKLEYLANFWKRNYLPNNFVLAVSGSVSPEKIFLAAEKIFCMKKGKKQNLLNFPPNANFKFQGLKAGKGERSYTRIDFTGFKLDSKERYASIVLAKLLENELTYKIRVTTGFAYYIDCNYFFSHNYGIFNIFFSCLDKALIKINRDVKTYLEETLKNITKENFERAKKESLLTFLFSLDRTSQRSDFYSDVFLLNKPWGITEEIENRKRISLKEVKKVAKKLFSQKPKVTVISTAKNINALKEIWNVKLT